MKNLAEKYDIDETRYAIQKTKTHGIICLEELDIILPESPEFEGYDMKKLIAYKVSRKQTLDRYDREIIGEIDVEIAPKDNLKVANLDGYAAKDKEIMLELFKFLENRAIEYGVSSINLNDAFGKEKLDFLPSFGYKYESSPYPSISNISKEELNYHTFNATLKDLDSEVESSESESEQ